MTRSKSPTSKAATRCPDCRLVFAAASLVKQHRAGGCASPLTLGLVQSAGVWARATNRNGR